MFKKFRDRLNEVGEEVKRDPRFQNSLASVNKIAQDTLSNLNREKSGSRESLQSNTSQDNHAQLPVIPPNNDHLFSLGGDEDNEDPPTMNNLNSPLRGTRDFEPVDLSHVPSTPRSRRLSNSSMSTEAASLFPIYEAPQQMYSLPSDLDSTAGSEWDDESSAQLSAITKEQLYQMLQKMRTRYHKYKGRYGDVAKAYTDLQVENDKVKTVMQQTQDKALRRISELREQCQLEQKAKRHLEEELRSDMEEKEHIIEALQTKVTLLKSREEEGVETLSIEPNLIELDSTSDSISISVPTNGGTGTKDSQKIAGLEEKVKRLESLLTKCKESIKANKQKTTALTEVKENLSKDLATRDEECAQLKKKVQEFETWHQKAQEEEIQIAETKMVMHQEIIAKDEEMGKIRAKLTQTKEDLSAQAKVVEDLKTEMNQLKESRDNLQKSVSDDKASVIEEMTKQKAEDIQKKELEHAEKLKAALEKQAAKLKQELDEKIANIEKEKERVLSLKEAEMRKSIQEATETTKLEMEELQLRLTALQNNDAGKSGLVNDLETKLVASVKAKKEALATIESLKKAQGGTERELESIKSENVQLEARLETLIKEKQDVVGKAEQERKQVTELGRDLEALRNENADFKKTIEALEQHKVKLEGTQKIGNDQLTHVKEELDSLKTEKSELQKTIDETNMEFEELRKNLENEEGQLSELKTQMELLNQEKTALQKALEEKDGSLEKLQKTMENGDDHMAALNNEVKELKAERDQLQNTKDETQSQLDQLQSQNCQLQQSQQEANDLQSELRRELESLKKENAHLQEINENFSGLKETIEALQSEQTNLQTVLENSNGEIESLKSENAELRKHKEQLEQIQTELECLRSEKQGLEDELEKNLKTLKEENTEIQNKYKRSKEEIDSLKSDNLAMMTDMERLDELKDEVESLRAEKYQQEQDLKGKNEEKKRLEDVIKNQDESLSSLRMELEALDNQKIELQKNMENEDARLSELSIQIDILKQELQSKDKSIAEMESKLKPFDELQTLKADLERQVHSLQIDNDSLCKDLSEKDDRINRMDEEQQKRLEELQSRQDDLINFKASMKTQEEESRVLSDKLAKLEDETLILTSEKDTLQTDLNRTRLERERENSTKDHMTQSIEYQKKLQDQLEAKEKLLEETSEKLKLQSKCHGQEVDKFSKRIEELTEKITEIEDSKHNQVQSLRNELESQKELVKARDELLKENTETLQKRVQELESEACTQETQLGERCALLQKDNHQLKQDISDKLSLIAELESNLALEQDQETKIKAFIKDYERKLAVRERDHEAELQKLRDESETELNKAIADSREKINELNHELYEKTTLYDDMLDKHAHAMSMKEQELEEEIESCSRVYQSKMAEFEAVKDKQVQALEQKLKEREERDQKNAWQWDHEEVEDLQKENHALLGLGATPATLAVSSTRHHNGSHTLEEATEFEYLKNILYQYMLGKESLTLAKVLATVVKFDAEQQRRVIAHEEKKRSMTHERIKISRSSSIRGLGHEFQVVRGQRHCSHLFASTRQDLFNVGQPLVVELSPPTQIVGDQVAVLATLT
ncbi:hypothetical protein TCAL_10647, partial [Tigriopus californicus]